MVCMETNEFLLFASTVGGYQNYGPFLGYPKY